MLVPYPPCLLAVPWPHSSQLRKDLGLGGGRGRGAGYSHHPQEPSSNQLLEFQHPLELDPFGVVLQSRSGLKLASHSALLRRGRGR